MRSLLIAVTLLFSSFALAEDVTLVLTGLEAQKGQVVTVQLRGSENIYITGLRVPADMAEQDELEIVLEDPQPGEYDMLVMVRKNIPAKYKKGEYAIGEITYKQESKFTIK